LKIGKVDFFVKTVDIYRNKVFTLINSITQKVFRQVLLVEQFFKIVTKIVLFSVFMLVITGALCVLPPKIRQMNQLEFQRNDLMRKIDYKKSEIESLKNKQQRFASDPDFVEYIARQNKRVRSNELLFVFESELVR